MRRSLSLCSPNEHLWQRNSGSAYKFCWEHFNFIARCQVKLTAFKGR